MLTIFIIEDDTVIRENVCTYLGLSGYSCVVFPDGKDALQAIGERRPDLIVCDIMMPGMDGYAFYHHVRNSYPSDSVPFIFLTAKADKTEIARGLELGAGYLTKPFALKDLLLLIEERLHAPGRGQS